METIIFGHTAKGETVTTYILKNANGMEAHIIDYGANLLKLLLPNPDGSKTDVVQGFAEVAGYEDNGPTFGSPIGRNGNRIGNAKFTLNGVEYQLDVNDGKNNLHSGFNGYHKRMWTATPKEDNSVMFSLISPDGDQGFPGEVKVEITYTLTEDNQLQIHYYAVPTQDTIINMTNHSYFNLEGHNSDSVLEQKAWIDADGFNETTEDLIPTGNILSVEGTPLDFRNAITIGERIETDYEPLNFGHGYDHNFILNHQGSYRLVAKLISEKAGRTMEVYTDLPGMQMYTANFLDGTLTGKDGAVYGRRSSVCFETQYYPDAPNHDNFPSTVVKADQVYETTTAYKFV